MDNAKIFPQIMSKSRGLLSVSDSNNAKTKKKAVRNCDIINLKIKSLLCSREYTEALTRWRAHFRNFAPGHWATQ